MNWYYIVFLSIIFLLCWYLPKKRRRRIFASQKIMKSKIKNKENIEERRIMQQLAQRFMDKDCIITLLEGTVDGVIKEVTEGGIVLEKNSSIQIVNLNFVMKIREYPYKKGKRVTFVGE